MLIIMVLTGVVVPVACWLALTQFYCRCCYCYRRIGHLRRAVAPNRQNPMLKMERIAYKAVHGPFPEVADVRGIVASAK